MASKMASPDLAQPHESLCEVCARTNFIYYFEHEDWDGFNMDKGPKRSVGHIRQNQSCAFCRLTMQAFSDNQHFATACDEDVVLWDARTVSSRGFQSPAEVTCSLAQHEHRHPRPMVRVHFILEDKGVEFIYQSKRRYLLPYRSYGLHVLADDISEGFMEHADGHNIGCGRMYQDLIDFNLVAKWLHNCEESHQCQKDYQLVQPDFDIRLIDVNENRIVTADFGQRYIALSYVWGNAPQLKLLLSNIEQFMSPNSLHDHPEIGRTIRDAMVVCKSIGERFLWVDSLCIIQNDPNDRDKMIAHMDRIYNHALLTIINATCTDKVDANTPLPGVSLGSRSILQYVETIGNQRYMVTKRHPFHMTLQQCSWNSRGWTFQENILSTRRLYFTDNQVYYDCDRQYYRGKPPLANLMFLEDTHLESPGRSGLFLGAIEEESSCDHPLRSQHIFSELEDLFVLLSAYSKRSVSYPTDILKAVKGVLQLYTPKIAKSVPGNIWSKKKTIDVANFDFFGLPTAAFDFAMCWQHHDSAVTERRPGFPSWSWAGWTGSVTFGLGELFWTEGMIHGNPQPSETIYTKALLDPSAQTYQDLLERYKMQVAPHSIIPIGPENDTRPADVGFRLGQLGELKPDDLYFRTSYVQLHYDPVLKDLNGSFLPLDLPSSIWTFSGDQDRHVLTAELRFNETWDTGSKSVDLIVIRASNTSLEPLGAGWGGLGWTNYHEIGEEWNESTNSWEKKHTEEEQEWWLTLLAIVWDDGYKLEPDNSSFAPRQATRIGIVSSVRIDGNRVPFLIPASKWMAMDPRPSQVDIILH